MIHQAGIGGWCGRKNLHLFGIDSQRAAGESLELAHILFGTAWVGGDQIVGEKLVFFG